MTISDKNKSPKGNAFRRVKPAAIPREVYRLGVGWWRHAYIGIPFGLVKSAVKDPSFVSWSDKKVYSIVGDALLKVIDDWGPLYGKAMQIWLSRLGPRGQAVVEKLNLGRVYGNWPPLEWPEVQGLLDRQIPAWRDQLIVDPRPMGVASLSQVHGAVDFSGKKWVVKFLKPKSVLRLTETISALESSLLIAEPFAVTLMSKRLIRDMRDLCGGLRLEMNLSNEARTMHRVRQLIEEKKSNAIFVPATLETLCTSSVIVMERIDGIKLSDIISGKADLPIDARKNLAKKILSELLIQIFEWGLFHADPHAGNLMLTPNGALGLFDWGLAGELLESDRKYIAGMLRAVMTFDIERLIDVLQTMGMETRGVSLSREKIRGELDKLNELASRDEGGESTASFSSMIEASLSAADRLGIVMPNGLLLMAKSLLTIEGLAKGIDENVAFGRVAGPVLFKAASPGFSEILGLVKKLPKLAGQWLKR